MKSYFIFTAVLTTLYILYFAVNIVRDLYLKKGNEKSSEEVFEIGTDEVPEKSVDVVEEEDGFRVGGAKYDTEAMPGIPPEGNVNGTKTPSETVEERIERLKAKAEAQMEEMEPYLSNPFASDEMYCAMISGGRLDNRPQLEWRSIKDKL